MAAHGNSVTTCHGRDKELATVAGFTGVGCERRRTVYTFWVLSRQGLESADLKMSTRTIGVRVVVLLSCRTCTVGCAIVADSCHRWSMVQVAFVTRA